MLTFVNINLVKPAFLGPIPTVLDPVGLDWVPKVCISNKFPDDADTAGLGTTFWESLV